MYMRISMGLLGIAAMSCVAADSASTTPGADEQPNVEALHRSDAGLACWRSYYVTKDKRVAQVPRDELELIDTLVPHHQAAVDMATIEIEQGDSPDIKSMAEEMKGTQSREIEQLRGMRERLSGCGDVIPMRDKHMQDDVDRMRAMSGAALDRMFLDEMIPHHASALSFTHNALPNIEDEELTALAHRVIDAQSMEVGHMHMMIMDLEGRNAPAGHGADCTSQP